ncbi:unnamed protein product [Closterium sp. NIES-53]
MADSDCRTRLFSSPEGCSLALSDSARSGSGSGSGSSCRASDFSSNNAGNSVSAGSRINAGSSSSSSGGNAGGNQGARSVATSAAKSPMMAEAEIQARGYRAEVKGGSSQVDSRKGDSGEGDSGEGDSGEGGSVEGGSGEGGSVEGGSGEGGSVEGGSGEGGSVEGGSGEGGSGEGGSEAAGYSADVDMAALLQLAAEVQGEEEEVGRLQQDLAIYSDLPTVQCGVVWSGVVRQTCCASLPLFPPSLSTLSFHPLFTPHFITLANSHLQRKKERMRGLILFNLSDLLWCRRPSVSLSFPLFIPSFLVSSSQDITLARSHLQKERARLRALSRKLEAWSMGEEVEGEEGKEGEEGEGYEHQSPGEGRRMGAWGVGGQGEGHGGVERSPGF